MNLPVCLNLEDTGTEVFSSGMGESLGVLLSPLVVIGLPKPASFFSSGRSSEIVASAVCSVMCACAPRVNNHCFCRSKGSVQCQCL